MAVSYVTCIFFTSQPLATEPDLSTSANAFTSSVLDENAEKTARWLATRGRPLDGQLTGIGYFPGPVTGAPVLADALGALECQTTAVHDGGDHSILVGEVIGVAEPKPGGRPLIHYSGRYRTLSDG